MSEVNVTASAVEDVEAPEVVSPDRERLERMVEEYGELSFKLDKATTWLEDHEYLADSDDLNTAEDYSDLENQVEHMVAYHYVLVKRIRSLNDKLVIENGPFEYTDYVRRHVSHYQR